MGFEATADGQGCFENEEVAVIEEAVPDSTGEIKLENVGVYCDHPLKEEDAAADASLHEDLVEFWQLFLHHSHENVEDNVDFVHVKAVKVKKHVFSVHDIGKNP